ncbi:MAG: CHAT domain-containing protein [Acidobacteriota bacterium]
MAGKRWLSRPASRWMAIVGFLVAGSAGGQTPEIATATKTGPETQTGASDAAALIRQAEEHVLATEYDSAFELLEEALEQSRAAGDRRLEITARFTMGLALSNAGAWQRSTRWIEDTLPLFEAFRRSAEAAGQGLSFDREEAAMRCDLARALNALGQRERARRELDTAETIYRRLGESRGLGRVAAFRSLVEIHSGRQRAAVVAGERALERLPDQGVVREETVLALQALSAVSYGYHQLGELEPALAAYERILELAWTVNDQRQMNFAYCNRAEIRWRLGSGRPVEEDLRRAIAGWESATDRIPGTTDQRTEYLGAQEAAYDRLARYLVETSRSAEAFEIIERFHARSFLEMLDRPTLATLGSRSPELWQRRQATLAALGQARLQLEEAHQSTSAQQLHRLEGELQAIESRLIWQRHDLTAAPAPPTLETVQAGLEPGEALVAYWLTDERVFAWVVFESGVRFVQMPLPRHEVERLVQAYLEPLRSSRQAEDAALRDAEAEHLEVGRELYRWLVEALPDEALEAQRLIIVPDGVLHYLPFESLVTSCDGQAEAGTIHGLYRTCRYLGLEKALTYSSSAGALLTLRQRQAARGEAASEQRHQLLAFAPRFDPAEEATEVTAELRSLLRGRAPLAHARDEVQRIAGRFPAASLRLDGEATESRLKREAGRYRLLHLATHGLVRDDHPMTSGVLLVPGRGDDGLLQAHEVMGLELAADIVTLSACRTGRGRLRRGAGIVGLSRAFLAAGASSVVVSLWDVDDRSTPRLMEVFYDQIAAGAAPPEAMLAARRALFAETTEAKLVFRTRPLAYAHPRFWSSFIVIGGAGLADSP